MNKNCSEFVRKNIFSLLDQCYIYIYIYIYIHIVLTTQSVDVEKYFKSRLIHSHEQEVGENKA